MSRALFWRSAPDGKRGRITHVRFAADAALAFARAALLKPGTLDRRWMKLFRPVGIAELELIAATQFTAFPPRLPEQPFFYPVLTETYAHEIARNWNTRDEASGYVGFVLKFDVDDTFVARYPAQTAGAARHQELWVPAAELTEFNRHIVGKIESIAAYAGSAFRGTLHAEAHLPIGLVPPRWLVLYRFREDCERIRQIQSATLTTEQFGLEATHGLVGSDKWWEQIADSRLPTQTLRGVISRVYATGMGGDWPEFEVRDDLGSLTCWTREVASASLANRYQVGRRVEIDYVVQRLRRKSYDDGMENQVVLEIRVDDAF
jgi:hypothetical protein